MVTKKRINRKRWKMKFRFAGMRLSLSLHFRFNKNHDLKYNFFFFFNLWNCTNPNEWVFEMISVCESACESFRLDSIEIFRTPHIDTLFAILFFVFVLMIFIFFSFFYNFYVFLLFHLLNISYLPITKFSSKLILKQKKNSGSVFTFFLLLSMSPRF